MITTDDKRKINKMCPISRITAIGDNLIGAPIYLTASIEAAANVTAVSFTVPVACEVVDIIVQTRAANAAGTATVRKVATAISDAMIMAVDKVIVRAGTIDDAQSTLAAGDNVNVITNGAADRGFVTLVCRRL